jgi:hypothetical protein
MKIAGREIVVQGLLTRIAYGCPWLLIACQALMALLLEFAAAAFRDAYALWVWLAMLALPSLMFLFWFVVGAEKWRRGREMSEAIVYREAFEKGAVEVRNQDGEVVPRTYVRWETTIEGNKRWWGLDEGDHVYYHGHLVFVAERFW